MIGSEISFLDGAPDATPIIGHAPPRLRHTQPRWCGFFD